LTRLASCWNRCGEAMLIPKPQRRHTMAEPNRKALEPDKEIRKSQSELDRMADTKQEDHNKQGGTHGAGQGKSGDQKR
jgi:hypothetical protein